MVSKKTPLNAASVAAVRRKLESLYLRQRLVHNLIRSLEQYSRFAAENGNPEDRGRKAA